MRLEIVRVGSQPKLVLEGSWEEFAGIVGNPESKSLEETVELMMRVWSSELTSIADRGVYIYREGDERLWSTDHFVFPRVLFKE